MFYSNLKKLISDDFLELLKNIQPSYIYRKKSYSQTGEDQIVDFVLSLIYKNESINYCDIGANSPWKISNTAKFYLSNKGKYTGVLIEPDPVLASFLKSKRPKDIIVNKGVKSENIYADELDFYIMDSKTLNTFSENEAKHCESLGYKIKQITKIEVININNLLEKYFLNKTLHFLSIDVEGLDFDILSSINFERFRPTCICIETINFVTEGIAHKDEKIIDFLLSNGYFEFAFTGINSIFVNKQMWLNR